LTFTKKWSFTLLYEIDISFTNQKNSKINNDRVKVEKIKKTNMKTVSFLQNQELFSKIPFFSFLTFLFLSLNPCWSFHLFLAETSLSLLTSVVYGFSSSSSMCFNTLWTFFWYSGEVFYLAFLAIYYILYLYEAFKHSGTKYSGTTSETLTPSESIFFLNLLIYFTKTSFYFKFSAKYDFKSGERNIFFLKSNCW